jgi:hypothetical protein
LVANCDDNRSLEREADVMLIHLKPVATQGTKRTSLRNEPAPASPLPVAQLPPRSCPRHARCGACPECQRLAISRSAAHLAASVQAAQEWARNHRAA